MVVFAYAVTTVNPVLETDQYPLPRPEDLMTCLTGGQTRSFFSLSTNGSGQRVASLCHSKHKGLYRYLRLPFGVSSALAVFQNAMDTILQGLPQVICYLDDILVTGSTPQEHYNPKLPISLAGDASNYGIGAVLSHVDAKGQEHPIALYQELDFPVYRCMMVSVCQMYQVCYQCQ